MLARWTTRVTIGVIIIGLVLGVGAFRRYQRQQSGPALAVGTSTATAGTDEQFSLLLLGADARPDDPGRSDTLVLAGIDLTRGSVRLLSVQRDTWAQIPGHGWDKINAAYAYGGEPLAHEALEKLLDLPVDHYVVVAMDGFKQIVDTLGGVDLNVDEDMNYDDPYDTPPLHIHLKKGRQHLNGTQALGYVRFRHDAESDYGRMRRQQEFLRALARQALLPRNWIHLPQLVAALHSAVKTDLSVTQMVRVALALKDRVTPEGVEAQLSSGRDLWIGGVYYLGVDLVAQRTLAYQAIYGTPPPAEFLAAARRDAVPYEASIREAEARAGSAPPASGSAQAAAPKPAAADASGPLAVSLMDASGRQLLAVYVQRLTLAGFRVVHTGTTPAAVERTTVVLTMDTPQVRRRLGAVFPGAIFLKAPAGAADAPLQVFLGKKT